MVSIAAFQAVDPGSIPGRRSFAILFSQVLLSGSQNTEAADTEPVSPNKREIVRSSLNRLIIQARSFIIISDCFNPVVT